MEIGRLFLLHLDLVTRCPCLSSFGAVHSEPPDILFFFSDMNMKSCVQGMDQFHHGIQRKIGVAVEYFGNVCARGPEHICKVSIGYTFLVHDALQFGSEVENSHFDIIRKLPDLTARGLLRF